MCTVGEPMARGLSTPLVAVIVGFAFIALTLYTIHSFLSAVNTTYSIALKKSFYMGCDSLRFYNASLTNGTIVSAVIVNEGSASIADAGEIGIVIVLQTSEGDVYSYTLKFCEAPSPGCWTIDSIASGSNTYYSYAEHRYLKPGEVLYITGSLPGAPGRSVYGYAVAFTRCSRAERVLAIGD